MIELETLMRLLATASLILLSNLALQATELIHFSFHLLPEPAVRLFWEVDQTSQLQAFEIERSTDNEHFQPISQQILCNTGLDYEFTDHPGQGVNNTPALDKGHHINYEQTYYYRLVYVLDDQSRVLANDEVLQVEMQLNTVVTTWGGIKAMFR